MKRILLFIVFFLSLQLSASNLLYDIVDGKYKTKSIEAIHPMIDGEYYTQLVDNKAIVKYNFKTGVFVDTLFSISRLKASGLKDIVGYEFSPNESKLLVYNNVKKRYRRSFTADYYVYNLKRDEFEPLSLNGSQEQPLFSPNSRYIAFARENNLFLKKLDFNTETAITTDGELGKIINGTPDWLYEEEFKAVRCFEWNADSKLLAFLKFDESEVSNFSFSIYDKTETKTDELTLYPSLFQYKYPKAGEKNPKVKVCVYDEYYKSVKTIKIDDDDDCYIPRIRWTNSASKLAVFKLNRNQNRLDMLLANPRSTLSNLILRQEEKTYIDYENIDLLHFLVDTTHFIAVNEQDGFRNAYLYNMNGIVEKQLTKGNWDVTDLYGYDELKKVLYYQSAEVSPMQRDVYAVDYKGKKLRLTDGIGTHTALFNANFSFFIDDASSLKDPNSLTLRSITGQSIRILQTNEALKDNFTALNLPKKELMSFTTSENVRLNAWMLKPNNFDSSKKYPVLVEQYSGPNSQKVLDKWDVDWEYYLATKNYIVVCVDTRGTGSRGTEFRKCTYQQLGVLETKDLVETAKQIAKLNYIDKDRIGIWGWSYGGFEVLMSMSNGEKIFKAGVAVSPVTDWRLYNSAFTERYMRRPEENFKGYQQTSPLLRASNLQGNLLLVHGSADNNVHLQNTMLYLDRLVSAEKQFDMQLYTDKNHNILGNQTRRHLYVRMSEFLFVNL